MSRSRPDRLPAVLLNLERDRTVKQVGFIGTGGMGSGMAANLAKAGFGLVINDVRREVARPLEEQGAVLRDSAREVAESCELVLSMLPYGAAVREVDG